MENSLQMFKQTLSNFIKEVSKMFYSKSQERHIVKRVEERMERSKWGSERS